MANIEYRTNEEHLIMKDINLNLASIEEVDNYKKKMFTRASYCESQIEIILKNDHSYDEIAVESQRFKELVFGFRIFIQLKIEMWRCNVFSQYTNRQLIDDSSDFL